MKPVMDHYVETGEVLGKGTSNLEGYTLPDKGYFRPGRLPAFDRQFFEMPLGRTEDALVSDLKDNLNDTQLDDEGDTDRPWVEFRRRLEQDLVRRSLPVDMGMDLSE